MGQVARVGALHDGYPVVVSDFPIQLAIAHVDGIHMPCAVLQKYIRKSAGGSADIHGDRVPHIRAEHAQRLVQLQRAAAHKGMRMAAHGQLLPFLHLFGRLENLDLPAVNLTGHDEGLGLFAAGRQPLAHQRLIHPQLIGHSTRPPL